jgi:hypothetical protein
MENHKNLQNGEVIVHVTCIWETKVSFIRSGVDCGDSIISQFLGSPSDEMSGIRLDFALLKIEPASS